MSLELFMNDVPVNVVDEPKKKKCKGCGEIKSLNDGYHRQKAGDGYKSQCKACAAIKSKERYGKMTPEYKQRRNVEHNLWRERNKERVNKQHRDRRKDPVIGEKLRVADRKRSITPEHRARRNAHRDANIEQYREKGRKHYDDNAEHYRQYNKEFRAKNPEKAKKWSRDSYNRHAEKHRQASREYYHSPEHNERLKANNRRYHRENKEELRIKQREWYEQNKEEVASKSKAYRDKNRDMLNKRAAAYRARPGQREAAAELSRKWRKENPELTAVWRKENREHLRQNNKLRNIMIDNNPIPDTWEPVDDAIIKEIYLRRDELNATYMQGDDVEMNGYESCKLPYHVDHIIPICKGGSHHQKNLRVIESSLNNGIGGKGSKLDEDWGQVPYCYYREEPYTVKV
tara:strand:+ start:573 stop:1775 length:1203 start_codon:yes stop_codon:yes gene_type:complete